MCTALDMYMEKGRNEGRIEGRIEKAREMATNLFIQGVGVDIIAQAAGVAKEEVENWIMPGRKI